MGAWLGLLTLLLSLGRRLLGLLLLLLLDCCALWWLLDLVGLRLWRLLGLLLVCYPCCQHGRCCVCWRCGD